ncbi:MAG: TonB-dependent receptor [Proteobacteria bacterium]|nr:TonB-dependent receptor [Pseudomonadota bacterium]
MSNSSRSVRQAVRLALTVCATTTAAPLAFAQTAPAAAAAQNGPILQEVVVTGSRIKSASLEAISPVTAVGAEEIKDSGVTRVEDLLNSLPQVVADQGSGLSMGSTGVANLNLRGLGVQRTLVLVNGRRLMPGDPTGGGASVTNLGYASAADVNQIPVALVERVDVLTGGASATYGADAVAGVVNFVMNDHFEGVRLDVNAGIYNHENHNKFINGLLTKRKFPTVSGSNWDGQNKDLTLVMGHNFADGAGNFEGYLGYRRSSPMTADHRDFASCVLTSTPSTSFTPYTCGGSSNSAPAVVYNQTTFASDQVDANGNLVKKYQRFNYAASHYLQRIDERYTAGFFGHLKFNQHVEAYTEFMFMDDSTRGNYAPAGIFLASGFAKDPNTGLRDGNWLVNCGTGGFGNAGMNPFLTQNEYTTLCSPGSPFGVFPAANGDVQLLMARRNVEGGPRQDEYLHTTWRMLVGARGDITDAWSYDASWASSRVRTSDYHNNDTSSSRMQNALLVIKDPVTGQPVCRGGQNGCVPWNIWNPADPLHPAAAAVPYFSAPGLLLGYGQEDVFNAFVSGDLTNSGVKLPTAKEGLKVVVGTEYRRETAQFRPDEEFITADLAGNGSPIIGYDAGLHVWEGFGELRMPLASDLPGAKSLDFEAGYRYSNYTTGFSTNTYKFGLTWAPISDVRLRGSYNRAVRAPNVAELFKPQYVGLDGGGDICANTQFPPATCALTNGGNPLPVYPAPSSPAGQYNGLIGGNTKLQPEVGKTINFGLVFTPTFMPGFSLTVDYTDIKISQVITSYGPNLIQANCIASNDPNSVWCQTNPPLGGVGIHRDPGGTLWASPQGYTIDPLINLGQLENKGIDVGLAYNVGMGRAGRLRTRLDGGYLLNLKITPGGGESYDCSGFFGPDCSPATPKWRHRLALDWDTPLAGLSAGAIWRYFGETKNELVNPGFPSYLGAALAAVGRPDNRIPTISYLDLHASYSWDKYTVRIGANNVLDKDPPLFDTINSGGNSAYAESNTFSSMYDTGGRFLYLHVTADF